MSLTDEQWLNRLAPMDPWNRRLFMGLLALLGIPGSYLDVGCGTGAMVEMARYLGIDALGVDMIAKHPNKKQNLATPLLLGKKYGLVTSLEVAEHIPEMNAGIFCNNIAHHMTDGGYLIFSAAPPGQEGEGHIHLKPGSYWRTMFHNRRVYWDEGLTLKLQMLWMLIPSPMMWVPANVQVFIMREETKI